MRPNEPIFGERKPGHDRDPYARAQTEPTKTGPANVRPERKLRRPERAPVTGYDPGLCEEVVEIMGEGYSLTAFAGHIKVSRETVGEWITAHPAFGAAVERGRAARACRLEDEFLNGGTGAKVAAHVFALKNAAPEDWRERPEVESAGKPQPSVVFSVPENGRQGSGEDPGV